MRCKPCQRLKRSEDQCNGTLEHCQYDKSQRCLTPSAKKEALAQWKEDNKGKRDPSFYCETDKCWQKKAEIPFFGKRTQKRHMDSHKDGKFRYECSQCSLGYTNRVPYDSHNLEFHPDLEPYQCDMCLQRFQAAKACDRHKKDTHGIRSAASQPIQAPASTAEDTSNVSREILGPADNSRERSNNVDRPLLKPQKRRRTNEDDLSEPPAVRPRPPRHNLPAYTSFVKQCGTVLGKDSGGWIYVAGRTVSDPPSTEVNAFRGPQVGTVVGFRALDNTMPISFPPLSNRGYSQEITRTRREENSFERDNTPERSRASSQEGPNPKPLRRNKDIDTRSRNDSSRTHGLHDRNGTGSTATNTMRDIRGSRQPGHTNKAPMLEHRMSNMSLDSNGTGYDRRSGRERDYQDRHGSSDRY